MTTKLYAEQLAALDGDGRPGSLVVEGDRMSLADDFAPDGAERFATIVPGFVDLHCHGALGHDFGNCTSDEARDAANYHASRGVTTLLATVATGAPESMLAAVDTLRPLVVEGVLAGIHLEGPYLSPARRGAHRPDLLRNPDPAELTRLLDAGDGAIRMVTLAPELPEALPAIGDILAAGAIAAAGHTDATAPQMHAAVDAGVTVLTHTFNGMRPLHHREPGPLGVALTDDRVSLELINDGQHVADEAVELLRRVTSGRLLLVSDAMGASGCVDGRYEVAGSEVEVADGVARTLSDGSLAGSTTDLGVAVERFRDRFSPSLAELVSVSSGAAAQLLKRAESTADASPSSSSVDSDSTPANLVAWDDAGVRHVMRNGKWIERSA